MRKTQKSGFSSSLDDSRQGERIDEDDIILLIADDDFRPTEVKL